MSNLNKFLQECRDIEAKATPKEWKSDFDGDVFTTAQKEYCPGMEQELFRTLGTTKCGPDRGDAEFIAFSRNNFLKLVQVVEILSGACGGAQEQVNRRLLDEEDGDLIAAHLTLGSALAKCEKILK